MKIITKIIIALGLSALVFSNMSMANSCASCPKKLQVTNAKNLQWSQVTVMPAGAEVTILSGDPEKPGPYVARIKLPANYQIPPHSHQSMEYDTIISGTLYIGADHKLFTAPAGGFVTIPANLMHSGFTKEETILQVNGMGPWGMVYKQG